MRPFGLRNDHVKDVHRADANRLENEKKIKTRIRCAKKKKTQKKKKLEKTLNKNSFEKNQTIPIEQISFGKRTNLFGKIQKILSKKKLFEKTNIGKTLEKQETLKNKKATPCKEKNLQKHTTPCKEKPTLCKERAQKPWQKKTLQKKQTRCFMQNKNTKPIAKKTLAEKQHNTLCKKHLTPLQKNNPVGVTGTCEKFAKTVRPGGGVKAVFCLSEVALF